MDPLSGKYPNLTPYCYAANNPIVLVDPNGKDVWVAENLKKSKAFEQGSDLLLRTALGAEAADAITNNHDILVAFVADDMGEDYRGATDILNSSSSTYNVTLNDGNKVTIDNPDHKFVFLVRLNDNLLSNEGVLQYSETTYHEIKSHVLTKPVTNKNGKKTMKRAIGDENAEHEYYKNNFKAPYLNQAKKVLKKDEADKDGETDKEREKRHWDQYDPSKR